jgi:hypothetical protein
MRKSSAPKGRVNKVILVTRGSIFATSKGDPVPVFPAQSPFLSICFLSIGSTVSFRAPAWLLRVEQRQPVEALAAASAAVRKQQGNPRYCIQYCVALRGSDSFRTAIPTSRTNPSR